jgi:hypothetical protein
MLHSKSLDETGQSPPHDRITVNGRDALAAPGGETFVAAAVAAVGLGAAEAELPALWVADRPLAGVDAQLDKVPHEARRLENRGGDGTLRACGRDAGRAWHDDPGARRVETSQRASAPRRRHGQPKPRR